MVGRPMMISMLKHFAAYSQEHNRGADSYNISQHDLFETYLAQYEIAFVEGRASGAMCSYTGVNGHPMCANVSCTISLASGLRSSQDASAGLWVAFFSRSGQRYRC